MPQVTVYIREDDLDQWKAVEKKSEFIHDALIMAKLPPEVLKTRVVESSPKVEQRPVKATVAGSTPASPAKSPITEVGKMEEYKFPPSAASDLDIIKTPDDVKKKLYPEITPKFIDKKYSARKSGSKERHIEL